MKSSISFVLRAKRRIEVLREISRRRITAPELRKITGMYKSHLSRTLKELSSKKLILCENPEDRDYKLYFITSKGKRILADVEVRLRIIKGDNPSDCSV